MARSKSSKQWLDRHFDDPYVKKAQEEGWRSRAVYKLLEIQEKDNLIRPGMTIVDLGAAPGGWSQVVAYLTKGEGKLFALDILPMDGVAGVEFIEGDFREDSVLEQLQSALNGCEVDLVLSDMAPSMSGQKQIDQPRMMYLAELAFDFALKNLATDGDFLLKIFQGADFDQYMQELRRHFRKVIIRKPAASRPKSREVYLLGRGFVG